MSDCRNTGKHAASKCVLGVFRGLMWSRTWVNYCRRGRKGEAVVTLSGEQIITAAGDQVSAEEEEQFNQTEGRLHVPLLCKMKIKTIKTLIVTWPLLFSVVQYWIESLCSLYWQHIEWQRTVLLMIDLHLKVDWQGDWRKPSGHFPLVPMANNALVIMH